MQECNPSADAGDDVGSGRIVLRILPGCFSSTLFEKAINSAVHKGKGLGIMKKMYFGRGEIIEALVRAFVIVEVEVVEQAEVEFEHGGVSLDVDVFVFDGAPKPFDKNVVQGSAAAIHADTNVLLLQTSSELMGSKLRTLICVENLRSPAL